MENLEEKIGGISSLWWNFLAVNVLCQDVPAVNERLLSLEISKDKEELGRDINFESSRSHFGGQGSHDLAGFHNPLCSDHSKETATEAIQDRYKTIKESVQNKVLPTDFKVKLRKFWHTQGRPTEI